MKTKRVIMYIEVIMIILGIIGSFYTSNMEIDIEYQNIIIDIFIGLLIAGMTGLLLGIPLYADNYRKIKMLLTTNSFYVYLHCRLLINIIDRACKNKSEIINENFCNKYLSEVEKFSIPLVSLDTGLFFQIFCNCKNDRLYKLVDKLDSFILAIKSIDTELKIKILQIEFEDKNKMVSRIPCIEMPKINNISLDTNTIRTDIYEMTNSLIKIIINNNITGYARTEFTVCELKEIKIIMLELMTYIDETMEIVLNKKELIDWKQKLMALEQGINVQNNK